MVAILIVLTIVGFLLADWVVQLTQARRVASGGVVAPASKLTESLEQTESCPPPPGLFFHKSHSWAQIEPSGLVRVGMDGLIPQMVGHIDEVVLPAKGRFVREGEPLVSVCQGSRLLTLTAPVEGEIVEVNEHLSPRALRKQSYTSGWLCAIKPAKLAEDTRDLIVGEDVIRWHRRELRRIGEFFASEPESTPSVVYDSRTGLPILNSVLEKSDDAVWRGFQRALLESPIGRG